MGIKAERQNWRERKKERGKKKPNYKRWTPFVVRPNPPGDQLDTVASSDSSPANMAAPDSNDHRHCKQCSSSLEGVVV